jgi:cytochrome P450/NADPH-cytochrome P450 reductase
MLNGRDPKTGQGLSDENIMYQLITFLIAGKLPPTLRRRSADVQTSGHETTSGVISFIVHSLLTTPESYAKLKAEIDAVVGERTVTLEDISQLPYMTGLYRHFLVSITH